MFGTSVYIDDIEVDSVEDVLKQLCDAESKPTEAAVPPAALQSIPEEVPLEEEPDPEPEPPEMPPPSSPQTYAALETEFMSEYKEYEKLEQHIWISYEFYKLDKEGRHIMNEIKSKKKVQEGSIGERILMAIKDMLKARMAGTGNLVNELYNLLDGLLFAEVETMKHFQIDDDEYRLTDVYYGQDTWISENFRQQDFEFNAEIQGFEEGEMMLVLCYFNNYDSLMEHILEHLEGVSGSFFLKKKIMTIIGQIQEGYAKVRHRLTDMLSETILG